MFPKEYHHQIFIAEHGSWNSKESMGYRVSLVRLQGDTPVSYEDFLTGFINKQNNQGCGRPVDVLQMPDGSLLVSDDLNGRVYRITYNENI